jgi:hypothetical protein
MTRKQKVMRTGDEILVTSDGDETPSVWRGRFAHHQYFITIIHHHLPPWVTAS